MIGAAQFDGLQNFSSVDSVATTPPSQAALPPLVSSQPPRGEWSPFRALEFRVCSILDSLVSACITASSRNIGASYRESRFSGVGLSNNLQY
jgi:hypothetical protein